MRLISILLLVLAGSLNAAQESKIDLSALRLTHEGGSGVRWIECHYQGWTALACWRDSDKERSTLIQIFIPAKEGSAWECLHEETLPYSEKEADRVDHIEAVPNGRVFMVIDRSQLLMFSYLGYIEEKEPIKRTTDNSGAAPLRV